MLDNLLGALKRLVNHNKGNAAEINDLKKLNNVAEEISRSISFSQPINLNSLNSNIFPNSLNSEYANIAGLNEEDSLQNINEIQKAFLMKGFTVLLELLKVS